LYRKELDELDERLKAITAELDLDSNGSDNGLETAKKDENPARLKVMSEELDVESDIGNSALNSLDLLAERQDKINRQMQKGLREFEGVFPSNFRKHVTLFTGLYSSNG
jgi:hypothetical protein